MESEEKRREYREIVKEYRRYVRDEQDPLKFIDWLKEEIDSPKEVREE